MSYLFETEDHAAIRASARRFAQAHIAPHGAGWEEAEEFPVELYATAAAAGITGVGYPESIGGQGGDLGHVLAASDELVLAGRSVGTLVGLGSHGIALPPIVRFGTPEQIQRFVTPCLRDGKIASLAITEPGGGSDVAALAARAERDGDHYVVTGAKTFITSGTRADFVTTAVRTGGPGRAGISLLVIERGTPGFKVSGKLAKMGWLCSDTAELSFDGVRVPARNLVGAENGGFALLMRHFVGERLGLATHAYSVAQRALDLTLSFVRQRETFGRPLISRQVVQHRLVQMRQQIELARTYTRDAVLRYAAGEQPVAQACLAKNAAVAACDWVVDQAVQLHGGM